MTGRATKALETLRGGGFVRYRLERNAYLGYAQFKATLLTAGGYTVPGFGFKTFNEIKEAGLLTGGPHEYRLALGAA